MEFYAAVRRSVYVEGLSERAAARRFGLARETVRKMLRYRLPPGYRRAKPIRCPKLDAFTGVIDQILTDDQQRPKKQRHTAKRIWERLCVEHAFTGGYTIVKDYVRRQKLGGQEMFVPLAHPPGDAQADFGEALVVIDGVECKAHYLVVDLPTSVPQSQAQASASCGRARSGGEWVVKRSSRGRRSKMLSCSTCSIWLRLQRSRRTNLR